MARIFLLLLGAALLGAAQNRTAAPIVPNVGFVPKGGVRSQRPGGRDISGSFTGSRVRSASCTG